MLIIPLIQVGCDTCEADVILKRIEPFNMSDVTKQVWELGWGANNGEHRCPDCLEKGY